MKTCNRCGIKKKDEKFHPGRLYCNKCHADYCEKHRKENVEKIKTKGGRDKVIIRMTTDNVELFKIRFDNGTEVDVTEEKFDELFETISNYVTTTTNGITTYLI